MLIIYAIMLGLLFLSLIPGATAMLAKRTGRNFWTWFLIGMILPVIGVIILCFLPEQNKNTQ